MCGTVRRDRVAVPQLGGTQREDVAWGRLQLDVGRPGARDGVVQPQPQSSQGPGYDIDPVAPCQGCKLWDGIVHFGADAMRAGNVREHPGGLGAHRGRAVVDEGAHQGHRCLHHVGTRVIPRFWSSCRLSREASKVYRACPLRPGP